MLSLYLWGSSRVSSKYAPGNSSLPRDCSKHCATLKRHPVRARHRVAAVANGNLNVLPADAPMPFVRRERG
eukprot:8445376-Pyramimonas_sp.AAC.1